MPDEQPLPPALVRRLRSLGVSRPDPSNPLHRDIVDVLARIPESAPDGVLNVALMWAWHAELMRQAAAYAAARAEYDRLLGRAVLRYRADGEKSAAVAEQKAHAEDDGVYQAHIAYRLTEQLVSAAREALRILHASNDTWRTQQANQRKGDEVTAQRGT